MRIMTRLSLLCLTIAATACTATPREQAQIAQRETETQQKLATALKGLTPGEPTLCLNALGQKQVTSYGSTFLYRVNNGTIYRTETNGGCGDLDRNILITRTPSGQLCRGDITNTIDRASRFPSGSCSFGEFVPYRKAR
ncbi:hypothetical protein [Sphingomonas aerolata]|uniref:hypothetical protein n=1 Tax=Sphingomonas aerolata TaxID=185951 RepID=UPI00141AA5EB|nr:hypothetical protein [Sphingomonas aerolata]NII58190.1 hypothetical protein [Sphingomonas aerolata]